MSHAYVMGNAGRWLGSYLAVRILQPEQCPIDKLSASH
jgi:hypothetical protein